MYLCVYYFLQETQSLEIEPVNTTLEKAVKMLNEGSGKRKSEFSAFGEHVANKLMTYDPHTRAHVEFEIAKILFAADMKMLNNKSNNSTSPPSLHTQDSLSHPSSGYHSSLNSTSTDVFSPPSTHTTPSEILYLE